MADPYIGEIKMFAGNFAPRLYAYCNGQLLSISQNTALFSILGTTYGGNGTTNFGLPNLQGSAAMDFGNGPGLTPRQLGEIAGETAVTLTTSQIPAHNHQMMCNDTAGDLPSPGNGTFGLVGGRGRPPYYANMSPPPGNDAVPMASNAIGLTGGGQGHTNLQPYLAVSFIIALQGIFPPRS
ncbi:tail fiber protein [soil metagenome]